MEIQYTYLSKGIGQIKENIHLDLFKKIFSSVTKNSFQVIIDKTYKIEYDVIYYKTSLEMFYMMLSFKDKPLCATKVISEVNDRLLKNAYRKDFYIVITWDEVSRHLCNKAFPLLAEFERKVRKLVYLILLKTFGREWFDKTVTSSLEDKLKEAVQGNRNKLIESALSEMTMAELEIYLFEPYANSSFNDVEARYSEQEIKNMDKDKLTEIITSCFKESLWNRYFKEINISLDKLATVRKYRNQIAHNKEFHYSEFRAFQKITKTLIKQVDSAIEEIVEREFDANQIFNSVAALNNMVFVFNAVKSALADFTPVLEQMRARQAAAREAVAANLSPALEQMRAMQAAAREAAAANLSPTLAKIKAIQEAQKTPKNSQQIENEKNEEKPSNEGDT